MVPSQKHITLLVILFFCTSLTLAQKSPVSINPEQPEPGDSITVTYHPDHPEAKIKSPQEVSLVKNFSPTLFNIPKEIPLTKTADGWKTQFKLLDNFDFATFYFKSKDQVDKNIDGQNYEIIGYKDDKPVKRVFLLKSYTLSNRYENLPDSVLNKKRIELYRKELKHHPDNFDAKIRSIAHKLHQEENKTQKANVRQQAYKILDDRLAKNPGAYTTLQDVQTGYKLIGEKAKGDSLENKLIEKYPESDIAMLKLYEESEQEKHFNKKLDLLERFITTDFEPTTFTKYYIQDAYKSLLKYYANQGKYEKAKKTAKEWLEDREPLFEHQIKSKNYLAVAQLFLEHENLLDVAMDYAQQALQQTNSDPAKTIKTNKGRVSAHLSKEKTQQVKAERKGNILSTIGQIYVKKEEFDKANQYFSKAQELSDSRTVHKYLANYYLQTEKPKAAFEIYQDILMEIPTNAFYQKKLKESYIAFNGSEEGFGEETKKIDKVWKQKKVQELNKNRINKEAPELDQITDLEGNAVDVNKFKNKVLVIDFWATWCKPCLEFFPDLQNIYEKYEDNPDVEFLILNSGWQNTLEKAKTFRNNNDYSFPYYFDKNSSTTEAFNVRGLPTTIFIDKAGTIQFKKLGLRGNNIEKSVSLRIEMLLNKKDYIES